MKPDVKQCVDARINFFEQYYIVPESVKGEVEAFCTEIIALAERSADATSFETGFASSDLNNRFTNLLTRCTPKPYTMTEAEKQASKEIKKEMTPKGQLAKDVLGDVGDSVLMKMESDAQAMNRKMMIEEGVFDDYTRATNVVEDIGWIAGLAGKFFKKRKDKNK